MNSVVFIFVPFDGSQREFDVRLRDCLRALETPPVEARASPRAAEQATGQCAPLWTWFLPNPRPGPDERR